MNEIEFWEEQLLRSQEISSGLGRAEMKRSVVEELRGYSGIWTSEDAIILMAFEVR
jgi:hypothetical protein